MVVATQNSDSGQGSKRSVEMDAVTVRFCGDSGDGMQLTGGEFTKASALAGNDISTLPDFPAEIRAPAGTTAGVSGFQIQFAAEQVFTPGDEPDVLVAMNPAALKVNIADVPRGGLIIINEGAFTKANLRTAQFPGTTLKMANFQSAHLEGAQLGGTMAKAAFTLGVAAI